MLRHAIVSDKPGGLSVQPTSPPPPLSQDLGGTHLSEMYGSNSPAQGFTYILWKDFATLWMRLSRFSFLFFALDMSDDNDLQEFLDEIQLMKAVGVHRNIVSMVGCCTVEEPMFLLVEYAPYGDLLHYLRKHRKKVLIFLLIWLRISWSGFMLFV